MSERYQTGSLITEDRPAQRDVLASDADRDAAAGQLSAALAEGRLNVSEHAERVEAAYAARTLSVLGQLTADLPAAADSAAGREVATVHGGLDRCLLCALLIFCPPAGIAWLLAARHRRPQAN